MSNRQETDFDYYDDVNEDIIGKPPKRILLWANIIIGVIFLTLLLLSIFLKLPSKINSPVEIIYSNPPVTIHVPKPWDHITFFIKDNSLIKKGDVIAQINGEVSYGKVRQLKEWLNAWLKKNNLNTGILDSLFTAVDSLGYLFKSLQQIRMSVSKTASLSSEKEKEIRASVKELLTKVSDWETMHLVKSPETGLIKLIPTQTSGNNSVENVVVVLPSEGRFEAFSRVPGEAFSQIKKGMKVQIKLINFPYESYGVLEGFVDSIFNVANTDSSLVKIDLSTNLVTTKGFKIEKVDELKGNSEIIFFERSILQTLVGKNYRL